VFVSLIPSIIAFSLAALVIVIAGSRLASLADMLADRTGLGEALFGILLLAGITSLPDVAATLSAAIDDRPDLAMSKKRGQIYFLRMVLKVCIPTQERGNELISK
jgi:cation:H+ antiporter